VTELGKYVGWFALLMLSGDGFAAGRRDEILLISVSQDISRISSFSPHLQELRLVESLQNKRRIKESRETELNASAGDL
jgi:hypothetical protein